MLSELDLAFSWLERTLIALFLSLLVLLGLAMLPIIVFGTEGEATLLALTRLALTWLLLIGAARAAGRSVHPSILLTRLRGFEGSAAVAVVAVPLVSCLICLALVWAGWKLLALDVSLGSSSQGGVPDWPSLAALPIGFGLMAGRFLLRALYGLAETMRLASGE
jgi:TRAP-type C4-dicarboxylate transport system permease small subunit